AADEPAPDLRAAADECAGSRRVVVRHCTFVPGWGLRHDCEPHAPEEPGIELVGMGAARIVIDHSIVGPLDVLAADDALDPVAVQVSDSIIDATKPEALAIRAPGGLIAHAAVRVQRATV